MDLVLFERRARYIVGFGAAIALMMALAWKLAIEQAASMVDTMPPFVTVLSPGYPVIVDGQVARVFGADKYDCSRDCVSGVDDGGVRVELGVRKPVTLVINGQALRESWTFVKLGDGSGGIVARRANGRYVFPAAD